LGPLSLLVNYRRIFYHFSSRRSSPACAARVASSTASARPSVTASAAAAQRAPEVIHRQEIDETMF